MCEPPVVALPQEDSAGQAHGGEVAAIRVGDWKAVYLENRADRLQIWKEPFVALRTPDLFNLRRDPFDSDRWRSSPAGSW